MDSQQANDVSNTLTLVTPLQSSLISRQTVTGLGGYLHGQEDGAAVCDKLFACMVSGELKVSLLGVINVYLDVELGTQISGDYWAGWSTMVQNYVATDYTQTPPLAFSPFLPCMCCAFQAQSATSYSLDPNVAKCFGDAVKSFAEFIPSWNSPDHDLSKIEPLLLNRPNTRCYGFWAKPPADPTYRTPTPQLDWSRFSDYKQPVGDPVKNFSLSVPVLLWRYAEYQPGDMSFEGGEKLSTDACDDTKMGKDSMLQINATWQLPDSPEACIRWGFDVGQRNLGGQPITQNLANAIYQAINNGKQFNFVGSYFRQKDGTKNNGYDSNIYPDSVRCLLIAGLRYFSLFERFRPSTSTQPVDDPQKSDYYNAVHGLADGQFAFDYAANFIKQPANTPIYFCIDCPPLSPNTDSGWAKQLDDYFQNILNAYQAYLTNPSNSDPVPYLIGVYAHEDVLQYCYTKGYASYFWYAYPGSDTTGTVPGPQNVNAQPHPLPWHSSNMWQYSSLGQVPWSAVPGGIHGDLNMSWGDEGSWIYRDF